MTASSTRSPAALPHGAGPEPVGLALPATPAAPVTLRQHPPSGLFDSGRGPHAGHPIPAPYGRRQRGIVLIVALIVMVALSLAGVALVRSVETTTAVVGNLAFRQAALLPANLAVEEASAALFKDVANNGIALIADPNNDMTAQNYFATRQAGEDARGVPLQLQKKQNFALPRILYADPDQYFEVRYIIERTCIAAGPATVDTCDMLPPKQSPAGTSNELEQAPLPQIPFYRLTVRVDGPKNTTAFLQTMLR